MKDIFIEEDSELAFIMFCMLVESFVMMILYMYGAL